MTAHRYEVTGDPERTNDAYQGVIDALVRLANFTTVYVDGGTHGLAMMDLTSTRGRLSDPTYANYYGLAALAEIFAEKLRKEGQASG